MGEERKMCRVLVGKPERKIPFEIDGMRGQWILWRLAGRV
jgi:hypothetical protein